MKEFLGYIKEDFKVNQYFHQRLFIFILRGHLISFKRGCKLLNFIFKIMNVLILQLRFNCDIPKGIVIGKRLRVPHPYNIIIKNNCILGDDILIMHEVTIGERGDNEETIIEDSCFLGCGAKILGVQYIGKNSKIGAGAICLKSVEANSVVVGIYK